MTKISFGKLYNNIEQAFYLDKAKENAKKSVCKSRQIGAVIVGEDDSIISNGYNYVPDGIIKCSNLSECPRKRIKRIIPFISYQYSCPSIHAEQKALLDADKIKLKNSTLFLYGADFVCDNCKLFLISAGVKDLYLKNNEYDSIKHFKIEDIEKQYNDNYNKKLKIIFPFKIKNQFI